MSAAARARCDHGMLAGSRKCVVPTCPEYDGKGSLDVSPTRAPTYAQRRLAAVTVAQSRAAAPVEAPSPEPRLAPPSGLPPIDVALAVSSAIAQKHAAELYAERHLTRRDEA